MGVMSSPATKGDVQIRQATPKDAEACGRIMYEAFATINRLHNFPPELPGPEAGIGVLGMLFSHPGFFCIVAERKGRLVGSNCLDERSTIIGLGPITIDPSSQDGGVGRMLMTAVLDRVRQKGAPGVRLLQSTFHNRSLSLYTKLGFGVRELMAVMHGELADKTIEGCTVRPATEADLATCDRLCEQVHGHNRSGELKDSISHGGAVVVERNGRITAYASGFGYFGHAVAESNHDLKALIASARDIGGPGIIVPTRNAELFRWCLGNGLRVFQPMTLMTVGLYNEPTAPYLPSVLY